MPQEPFTKRTLRLRSKSLWALLLRASGLLRLAKRWAGRNGLMVLTFHRVLTAEQLARTSSMPGMVVTAATFDKFLEHACQRYQIIDLAKDREWCSDSRLKIAVTFDDGWCDNATSAYPIARRHGAPMTIFIVPQRIGETLPFWPERAVLGLTRNLAAPDRLDGDCVEQVIEGLKELPAEERKLRVESMTLAEAAQQEAAVVDRTMTWQQIAELHAGGVTFGSHTSTHEILTCIPVAQAEEEISGSRGFIEDHVGRACSLFSYPNGNCSPAVRDLVAAAGYRLAFLNDQPGIWTRDCDPYLVPRINVSEKHLINARGSFSPLMFEYTVVWKAARGLMSSRFAALFRKVTGRDRNLPHTAPPPAEKNQEVGLATKRYAGKS